MTTKLDETDRRILRALQTDSSRSQRELADEVGLSQNAFWRRLKTLESSGVIKGYRALLNREAAGASLVVFSMIKTRRHSAEWARRFRTQMETIPEVVSLYRIGGEFDYMLKIVTHDIAGFDQVYQRMTEALELDTVTSYFAMEAMIEDRPIEV